MSSTLTVGITTRHRPEALLACLQSMTELRHLDPEIRVFDDASSLLNTACGSVTFVARSASVTND